MRDLCGLLVIRIAESLGASRVLLGTYEAADGNLSLSLRILDVSRGTLSAPLLASGRTSELRDVLDGLGTTWLLPWPRHRPSPARSEQMLNE